MASNSSKGKTVRGRKTANSGNGGGTTKSEVPEEPSLDIHRILAERLERERRERELKSQLLSLESGRNVGLSEESFSISCIDSMSVSHSSQDASQKTRSKLHRLAHLNIFEGPQVFRFFNERTIKISKFMKADESGVPDIPKMEPAKLYTFLMAEFKNGPLRKSAATSSLCCRYLFHLLSVTTSPITVDACVELLTEKISCTSTPYSLTVADVLGVLLNYGTITGKLWPAEHRVAFPIPPYRLALLNRFDSDVNHAYPFPRPNLKAILEVVNFNMKTYPAFTHREKVGLFHTMLNLAMATEVVSDWDILLVVKGIVSNIFLSFNEDEWKEKSYAAVEDLAEISLHSQLDHVGLAQRIRFIPTCTLRGIQVQQAAAYFAIQNLMDFDPINLSGRVTLDDVEDLLVRMKSKPITDFALTYSTVMLISLCVDLDSPSLDTEIVKEMVRHMKEWQHSIRDIANDMDENRLAIKDFMTELCSMWHNVVPVNHVV